MADNATVDPFRVLSVESFDIAGLQFEVSFRGSLGATLRISGDVAGQPKELLRFDDFVDMPHYHVPADAHQIDFDPANGEPFEWFLSQIGNHLTDLLREGGFPEVAQRVDMDTVRANLGTVRGAMTTCVPEGFVRVPGVGLKKTGAPAAG